MFRLFIFLWSRGKCAQPQNFNGATEKYVFIYAQIYKITSALNETHLCHDSNSTEGAGSFIETNDSDNHALTDAPAHESALDSVFFQSNIHSADTDLSNSTNHLEISQSQSHVPSASYAEEITTSSCSNDQGNPINLSEISCPQSSPSANSSFASSTQHQSNDPLADDANEAKEIDDENLISRIDLTFSSPLPLSIAITPSPTPPHPHRSKFFVSFINLSKSIRMQS